MIFDRTLLQSGWFSGSPRNDFETLKEMYSERCKERKEGYETRTNGPRNGEDRHRGCKSKRKAHDRAEGRRNGRPANEEAAAGGRGHGAEGGGEGP